MWWEPSATSHDRPAKIIEYANQDLFKILPRSSWSCTIIARVPSVLPSLPRFFHLPCQAYQDSSTRHFKPVTRFQFFPRSWQAYHQSLHWEFTAFHWKPSRRWGPSSFQAPRLVAIWLREWRNTSSKLHANHCRHLQALLHHFQLQKSCSNSFWWPLQMVLKI